VIEFPNLEFLGMDECVPFALVLDGICVVEFLRDILSDKVEDEFVASFGGGCVCGAVPFIKRS